MKNEYHILDKSLPKSQDFKSLKAEGLAFVQEFSGAEWNNLNPSDAGVTILDQICYALTELGYCNAFPIKEILSNKDDQVQVEDQFYLPEQILTSAPITIPDFVKYCVDGIEEVDNAIIIPVIKPFEMFTGVYKVFLKITPAIKGKKKINKICRAAFFLLNKRRSLGATFLFPKPLKVIDLLLKGVIEIEGSGDLRALLVEIQDQVDRYVFPKIPQSGYYSLKASGWEADEIFNGPILKNGWSPESPLPVKNNTIRTRGISAILQSISGVGHISDIHLMHASKQEHKQFVFGMDVGEEFVSGADEIVRINIVKSVTTEKLKITYKGQKLKKEIKAMAKSFKNAFAQTGLPLRPVSAIEMTPNLPKSKYRDINTYYSIQNTFPEIFPVGDNAITTQAPDSRIAQSKQLIGYLTLIDQVLANQFSQLANVKHLFSFKNSFSGNPSDEKKFYAKKENFQKEHLQYPVPYQCFSPTYFYQSLYKVPNIRPLLKDSDIFEFSTTLPTKKKLREESWKRYKDDPYNSYIRGLMGFMEDDNTSLTRRNEILDHLLARHGESPLVINAIIQGSVYSGEELKDRVIFKSLYLQNLGLLSYYRQKGYDFIGSRKLCPAYWELEGTPNMENSKKCPGFKEIIGNMYPELLKGYTRDFIFNQHQIDDIEKLDEQDFINYSALELKLNLLLGLKYQYKKYIHAHLENSDKEEQLKLALWLHCERKGMILLETNVLLQSAEFQLVIAKDIENGPFWQLEKKLCYKDMATLAIGFQNDGTIQFLYFKENEKIRIGNLLYRLRPIDKSALKKAGFESFSGTELYYAIKISWGDKVEKYISYSDVFFSNTVHLIFPKFIPQFKSSPFKKRLRLFLESILPIHLEAHCHFLEKNRLKKIIPEFINWHNCLIYKKNQPLPCTELSDVAGILATRILELNRSKR